jgi:hypothetical protein
VALRFKARQAVADLIDFSDEDVEAGVKLIVDSGKPVVERPHTTLKCRHSGIQVSESPVVQ